MLSKVAMVSDFFSILWRIFVHSFDFFHQVFTQNFSKCGKLFDWKDVDCETWIRFLKVPKSLKIYCFWFISIFKNILLRNKSTGFSIQNINWQFYYCRRGFDNKVIDSDSCIKFLIVRKLQKVLTILIHFNI